MDAPHNLKCDFCARVCVCGWCTLQDVVSVLPFDPVSFMLVVYAPSLAGDLSTLKLLRIVRLLRLVKLLRVLRASRILGRWESSIGLSYAALSIIKFSGLTLVLAHWLACMFRVVASFSQDGHVALIGSWLHKYGVNTESPIRQYVAALYWSITTVTTVGPSPSGSYYCASLPTAR